MPRRAAEARRWPGGVVTGGPGAGLLFQVFTARKKKTSIANRAQRRVQDVLAAVPRS